MIKKRSFGLLILLSIITLGIYGIIFWYTFNEDVNKICEGEGKPLPNYIIVILLSIITCGIYTFVWSYNIGDKMQRVGNRNSVIISEGGSTILLWMLIGSMLCGLGPFIGMYILVKNMNLLAENYNAKIA
ncbi:DUF4234 domain-containing protein [Clostridium uliginosum]|uniref:DUF4234 domain-containing protein n=1 Tax=Clostridium uliginosum TaxID=119641 RepID=A0A1I1MU33_9CLOT|nr:DUF4234 domain-containing protein [Clostridium uliginosum]SFC88934.1 protein of unknown function [Clostridium uliginosum]